MHIEELRNYCLDRKGVTEEMPFGDGTLVFKVMGKMFAAISLDEIDLRINLKCDPERAVELRASFPAITPGYHMNKQHWNTLLIEMGLPSQLVKELVNHSYDLVVNGLTLKQKKGLEDLV
jgi:predicted DNA-binding protein (MmcQ/YjbR family)